MVEWSLATNFLRCRTCCNIFDWYDTCRWSWTFELLCKVWSFYLGSYLTLPYTQALQTSVNTKFVVHQSSEAFELVWNLSLPALRIYLYIPVSSLASSGAVCYSCSVQKKSWTTWRELNVVNNSPRQSNHNSQSSHWKELVSDNFLCSNPIETFYLFLLSPVVDMPWFLAVQDNSRGELVTH